MKHTFQILIIGTLGLSLASDLSTAQVAGDNDLYAAYCFGVFRENYKQAENIAEMGRLNEDTKQRASRFKSYLTARGFITGDRSDGAVLGVKVAIQRGKADSVQCSKVLDVCILQNTNVDVGAQCVDQSMLNNPACVSSARCDKPDNLPF
jgi:hypothetical protein